MIFQRTFNTVVLGPTQSLGVPTFLSQKNDALLFLEAIVNLVVIKTVDVH